MATPISHEEYENLRAHYKEANAYSMHLTSLNWEIGSILIAGSLAAVGLSLQSKETIPTILLIIGAIIAILTWFLFLRRNRDFGEIAANTMIRIEYRLSLGVNWGVQTSIRAQTKQVHGPSGYKTARFLTVGLISTLTALAIYLLIFPLH